MSVNFSVGKAITKDQKIIYVPMIEFEIGKNKFNFRADLCMDNPEDCEKILDHLYNEIRHGSVQHNETLEWEHFNKTGRDD